MSYLGKRFTIPPYNYEQIVLENFCIAKIHKSDAE